ncbi:DUF1430 domain-containing protein [Melissococcus plutonius]|uniref:DUF1430 domain-containing protein n=1 Tax=Melissococcus plutonius TaxID=33970 RepID=UPI0021E54C2A|nr:DUF1430 domain-containing protein [Melissococcus plutonius]MCV2505189.1 DUF1430 domain-containing protein [Melissococcus plutonius]
MKKIVSAFLALMVIFSGFIVINLYQTKDQERLENIEQTSNSFKIYVSNTTQTPDKMLPFFQKLSDEKKISIIRTDFPKDKVLKSVIINQASFPFQNFFQKDNVHTIKTMKGINLKFSTIASILSTQVDTMRLGLQMAATLLLIIFLVSLIVSAFVCVLYFTTNKMTLSIQRALGIKLVDRYRKVIAAWLFVYLIQIIVATVFSHSIVGLGAGVLLALIDILISLSIFYYQESKNLIGILKGE